VCPVLSSDWLLELLPSSGLVAGHAGHSLARGLSPGSDIAAL
jgi:hypothetical protein